MAPPPATASAAAGDPAEAEPLEVRCAGCGETLEVDRGLTEFICPDCATPQSLPPELMPPPPPRRKALPLPRGAADVRGARLPCGSCGALLSVPVGLPRCACPLCGAELAVDTARLRHYLLSSAAAVDAVPVVPLGTSSAAPPILQALEAQIERPSQLIPEQAESGHPDYTVDEVGVHGVNEVTTRYKEQRNLYSGDPRIVRAENRQGVALNQGRHQGQDLPSSYSVHTKQTYQEHSDRVIEAPQDSVNSEFFRESRCIAHINDTTSTDINGTTGRSIQPKTVAVEKRNMQAPKYITHKSQKKLASYVISPERAQEESANGAIRVQEKQPEPVKEANHTEEACTQLVNEIIADDNTRRRTRRLISLNAMGAEKRQGQTTNEATQEVQKEQSDSVIRMALNNKITHVEKEQSGRHRVNKKKRKGLIAASNSGLQLRRSKRLAKDSSATVDKQPIIVTELTHREIVGCQAAASSDHMPAAITGDELTESEPDELPAASPVQNSSGPPDIDRIINNLCTSSSPRHEIPQTSSNEFENLHSTVLISSSNPDMSDPKHFARTYIPLDVRRALAKLGSKSLLHRMMSQTNSDEAYLLQLASQNNGQHGGRGLTLCLKVWTLPRGVRIPVSLNTSGEPIGKEAATLSAFLGALARDGVLAPLVYHDWRRVPEKNKDVMCHIAKLKFDIAPVGELWIVKNLGKKWKSWKALLKQKHFDTHETEEERLADRNPRVLEEQWRFLVAYWSTEKAKAASARNKACQSKITTRHTSGTKSFARIIEEERQKRPDKDEPTPEDLFILTHTPKDGKPINKAAADAIARFRELSQKRTEGSGSDSTAHSFGLGSYPNGPQGKAALKESLREAMEAKKRAEDEAATLRKKMIAMEESQRKLRIRLI